MPEEIAYILGTDEEELHRLGFQHQVWSEAAHGLWERAGFSRGQVILDLGCGPGYDAIDLAHIVGPGGKVIAVDKAPGFTAHLRQTAQSQRLAQISVVESDSAELQLAPESLDGAYARWALCWVPEPEPILNAIATALRAGGAFTAQEYINWSTLRVWPRSQAHQRLVDACLESWELSEGEIDIGGQMPSMLQKQGLRVEHVAPLSRIGRVGSMPWRWVTTFFDSYIPRLIANGLVAESDFEAWKEDQQDLEQNKAAFCYCPQMVEVIGIKP